MKQHGRKVSVVEANRSVVIVVLGIVPLESGRGVVWGCRVVSLCCIVEVSIGIVVVELIPVKARWWTVRALPHWRSPVSIHWSLSMVNHPGVCVNHRMSRSRGRLRSASPWSTEDSMATGRGFFHWWPQRVALRVYCRPLLCHSRLDILV